MTEKFNETLRRRALGEEARAPEELLERGAAALAELQAVLEELAAAVGGDAGEGKA